MRIRVLSLLALVLTTGCGLLMGNTDARQAEQAVIAFFDHLSRGEYDQADALYGADYQPLTHLNPAIPPEEHTALWRNACEINGFQCLPVLRVVKSEKFSLNEYIITVEFKDAQGNAFVFGPCCGASEEEMPPESQYDMFVIKRGGQFLVTSLPALVP